MVRLEFGLDIQIDTSRKIQLVHPSELRTGKQHKSNEESGEKSTNVGKIINAGQNSNAKINNYDHQKSKNCCNLCN